MRTAFRLKADLCLEADFQDLPVVSHEPTGVRIRESNGPVSADFLNPVPVLALVQSIGSFTLVVVGFGFGGHDDGSRELIIVRGVSVSVS